MALYIVLYLYSKKIHNKRSREQFVSRVKFILLFSIIAFMFIIWIPGFWRIVAVLGFVAGAFIITQKSILENLFSYFIISWRGLFTVGDVVKIKDYLGKVRSLGLFYFTLNELHDKNSNFLSGNIIKIPNGYISKKPLINYSDYPTQLYTLSYVCSRDTNIELIEEKINSIIHEIKESHAELDNSRSNISMKFNIQQNDPAGIKVIIYFSVKRELYDIVKEHFELSILKLSQKGEINLVYK